MDTYNDNLPEHIKKRLVALAEAKVEEAARAEGLLTHSLLLELLSYDPATGLFTHLKGKNKGDVAGWSNDDGYVYLTIRGTKYQAHRVAWFYSHGTWPVYEIDHKDRVRNNNKLDNLRDVTHQVNATNKEKKDG
jgi:hypothetical protein